MMWLRYKYFLNGNMFPRLKPEKKSLNWGAWLCHTGIILGSIKQNKRLNIEPV